MAVPPDNDLLRAVGLRHAPQGFPVLTDVTLGASTGEILAVTGPRAAGKTTLLRCLSGQLVPDEGEVWFADMPVHNLTASQRERFRREHLGWIDSEPHLVPELSAWENAALPLLLRGTPRRTAKSAALEWLDRFDLGALAGERPHALAYSQRQQVCVARAIAMEPAALLADEPTAALRGPERAHVLRTLVSAARSNDITVVIAATDEETASVADRTLRLYDGRTDGDGPGSPEQEGREECSLSV
ncbi:ABC transporter ATP-binding protein [Streptomyces diastaticus]|uniref:ABC transporter ATP-binding protein n=2 Tax=Streptomyces TaxID=1883 RepID=A0A380MW63_STRGR|nr:MULTISPECIES: ATP-binding cassette domain-containing protein [Streptomyces]MBL3804213.1 ATP-binding cassette domain-containing protein [Streptomyces sp. BRB081]QNE83467.1 ATP-binding cassette domain-containing protein [Streptomyces rutgersensis]SUO96153.1 ABC transporter ATP-binding protein [Streptomyces griseus]